MRFYRQFVKPGDLCFDLGAHLGNRSDAWLRLGAKVIAVDPQPICIEYLEKHFGSYPNFTLVKKAIGEHPGQMNLHISEKTPTISTLAGREWQQAIQDDTSYKVSWDRSIAVEVITLDQLIETYGIPAFCKIDIEDFELQALRGLSQAIPALSFEFFVPTIDRAIECIKHLETIGGYQYNWSFGESQKMAGKYWINGMEIIDNFSGFSSRHRTGDIYARQKK
ncbi:MAG: FkbM family methyltransferase [Desulfocapsaceae bacterium]|nr:FkbM family methyltransferase [Desulfocapsaceae bacterium]